MFKLTSGLTEQRDTVLKILYAVGAAILPSEYYTHLVIAVYAFAHGRKTRRRRTSMAVPFSLQLRFILTSSSRCLADTILFVLREHSPRMGLTLLNSLAQRGAYIIALITEPPDTGAPATLVSLLRSTTSNEDIYAE